MAKELQDRYKEYTRRKVVPFKHTVEQGKYKNEHCLHSNPKCSNLGFVKSHEKIYYY